MWYNTYRIIKVGDESGLKPLSSVCITDLRKGADMAKNTGIAPLVEGLVTPKINELGYDVWDVEYVKEGAEWYLRITIDHADGIDIEGCEKVHRAIEVIIDEADPIEDFYYLEVSSPGIERTLRKKEHFAVCEGEKVEIRLFAPDANGKKSYVGVLKASDDAGITLDADGEEITLAYSAIGKANTFFEF
jgi:ribosome maturation factor RimP